MLQPVNYTIIDTNHILRALAKNTKIDIKFLLLHHGEIDSDKFDRLYTTIQFNSWNLRFNNTETYIGYWTHCVIVTSEEVKNALCKMNVQFNM